MSEKVISLVTDKDKVRNFIRIVYTNNKVEDYECDWFGVTEQLPNFITIFDTDGLKDDVPSHFINIEYIRGMSIISEEDTTNRQLMGDSND